MDVFEKDQDNVADISDSALNDRSAKNLLEEEQEELNRRAMQALGFAIEIEAATPEVVDAA